MYNPQELQRKAQLNIHGIDTTAQTSLSANNPPKQENEQHWLVRGLATVGNFVSNIVEGAVKSIEGIVDAGAMLVGLFGADVDEFVSYDFTADIFGADEEGEGLFEWSWGRNLADVSYLDNENIVNQIAEGVGGLLPTVAIGILTGGTSLGATAVGKGLGIASKVGFYAGAAGNASESALQEGATYGQALGYGALSGAIEAGTEMIGGRVIGSATKMDNTLLGKLALKTGTDKFISKGVGKAAYSFASEGLEEVVADLLDPVNKRITGVDSEATVNWSELPKTFFIGGSVGALLDGVQNGASALIHKKQGGKHFVNVSKNLQDIVSSNSAIAYLQENKKVSQENLNKAITRNTERTLNNLESISEELKQMTKEQRAKAFETINSPFINSMFEENGSLKEGVLDSYSEVLRNGAKYNVSSNLLYENNQVEKDITKINEQYNANYEISDTELNQKQRQEFAKINRNVSRISKKSGVDFEFVLLKDYVNNNGKKTYAFIDKNRLYVTESGLENGTWAQSLSHEIGHFAENSKEYREYAKYITSDTNLLNSAIDDVVANYFEDYGINAKEGKILVEKVLNGDDKLSKNEKDFYGEVVAHITESLFKSEASITRFTRENTTLAQKILSKIKDLLNMFRGTNAKRDAVVNLRKAEILFERALDSINKEVTEARNKARINIEQYKMDKKEYLALPEAERENWLKDKGYKVEDFADDVVGYDEEVDNSGEIRYSFKGKKTARYINKKLDTPTLSFIRNELRKIYGPIDSAIADGIAIEKDNTIFVVDSGMEDGLIDFGVRQQIKIDDDKLRKERLEKINDRAVSNGFSSSEISGRIKRSPDNGGRSSVQRELQKELSDNTRKSENNESRISEKDATDGSRRLKFSLKDSEKSLNEKFSGLKPIQIKDEKEYQSLERELEHRNGNHPSKIDWAMTDKYLYIVKDNTYESFTPIVKIDCKKYQDFFMRLTQMIDYNNYNPIKTIDAWMTEIFAHPDSIEWLNPDPLYDAYNKQLVQNEIATTLDDGTESSNYKNKDSFGRELSEQQIEFFKDSKVRDRYGRLKEVYHGTYGEFYTFDKSLLGTNIHSQDAKLGFFFTASKRLAEDYSSQAKSHKMYNLMYKVANGDTEVLKFLSDDSNFYDSEKIERISATKEYSEINKIKVLEKNNKHDVFSVYLDIKNPYIEDWNKKMHNSLDMVRAITKALTNGYDGVIIKRVDASITESRPADDLYIVFEPNQIKDVNNKAPTKNPDIRFSKKITADMTDSERYDILKDKKIENIPFAKELTRDQLDNIQGITSFEDLNKYFGAEKRNIIKKIASEFGVFKEYYNKDIELEFEFSKGNYNESYQKQKHDFVSYAKMFSVFDDVIEKAVGIEVHNRNIKNYKEDQTLKNVYVLASAFIDDQSIVPVKLEIKEFNDKNNKLYVAIALDKIKKTEVLEDRAFHNKEVTQSSLSVNISIRDLLKNVNPNDKDFYKYIPKQFFKQNSANAKFSRTTMSSGEYAKLKANLTQEKVYSKKEATSVVNEIIDSIDLGDNVFVKVANKSKEQVANEIWKFLNDNPKLYRVSTSEKIADYIIDSMVLENALTDDDNQDSIFTINAIKPYLHSFDLSHIKDEIKYRHGHGGAFALWGARKGKQGLTADQVAQELEGKGIYLKSITEADMFFEIIDMYSDAVRTLKEKGKKPKLNEALTDEDLAEMRKQIKMDILNAFDKKGSQTAFAKMIIESSKKAEFWKVLYYDEKNRNRAENNLVFEIERLETAKKGAVTDYVDTVFNQSIGLLTRLKFKNSFNRSGARNIIQNLIEWAKNPKNLIFTKDEKFNQVILPKMEMIAGNTSIGMSENGMALINKLSKESGLSSIGEIYKWYTKDNVGKDYNFLVKKFLGIYANEKKFSVNEIKALSDIVHYFRNYLEETKQIRLNDKLIESKDLVEKFVGQIDYNLTRKYTGAQRIYLASMFNQNRKREYYRYFIDGKSIARVMDRYEDGVCTFMMNQLEQGEVTRAITSMSELNELNNFYKKHKKFEKKIEDKTVKYLNEEIPLGSAMFLYMQLRSEDAITSLMASGFYYTQKNGLRKDVPGFNPELFNDESATKEQANKLREELEKQFDAEDKEFILICEDLFNNKLRRLKVKTDEKMLGFSNVIDGYYVPKYMSDMSKKIENYDDEIASVSNQSFNKSRSKGAYGRLKIESLSDVIKRHSEAVIKYYSFAEIERNINIVRNLNVSKDEHNVKTVNTEMSKVWKSFNNYFEKLYKDIRGVTTKEAYGFLESARSGYVKSVLGFNPKVLANQLSSYISAGHILDYKSLAKGLFVKSTKSDIDKYCQLAEYRREENVSAQSQGLITDASSKLLSGIGFVDSKVIQQELGACQVQVQKDTGLKIGTEENKVKAGELLQKVILETQQNSFMTSQTEASRSSNTGLKWLTSFKADAIKSFGRWVDSLGMLLFAKEGEAKSKAKKRFIASSSTIMLQAVYLATITSLFNKFFNKDDDEEDENKALNFIVDAITNLFSGLPILGDVINSLTSGFDMEDMSYGVINDVIDSTRNVIDLFDGNTDSREVARGVRSVIYSISSVMGIPTKNVYKLIYGTTNLISAESAYKMDDFFYKQSYSKDLKKAILNEDEEMIATIAGLIMDENVGDFENGSTRNEVNRLLSTGFDVLPQAVGNSMTINEVQYTLTGPQKENFKKVYSQSISAVDKLVSSNGYKIATDEAKAKAIKYIYKYYYYEAQHQALNVDLDSKLYLFGQIVPIEKMALALAEVPLLVENSTNKKTAVQRYLQASKLTSAQKYMLMGYFGYKNTKGEGVVKSAINKTSLTKEQKKLLLEKCGY